MKGWQTVSMIIKDIPLEKAKMLLRQERFVIKETGEHYVLLRRKGTSLTTEGRKVSIEAAVIEEDDGIRFQLRYDTFVLFDTGDLKAELQTIAEKMTKSLQHSFDPVQVFKTLGDDKRLGALNLLAEKSMYNSELSKCLNLKPTTMSHHMAKLMDIGVVNVQQGEQNKSMYVIDEEELKRLLEECYLSITKKSDL